MTERKNTLAGLDLTLQQPAQRRAEWHVAVEHVLAEVANELLALPVEHLDQGLATAVAKIAETLDADRGLLLTISADGQQLASRSAWTRPGLEPRTEQGPPATRDLITALVARLQRQEAVAVEDMAELPEAEPWLRALTGCQPGASLLLVPLVASGGLTGALSFESSRPRPWPATASLLPLIGQIIAGALWRGERERTLREREAELNATLEATLDGVLVLDSAGRVIHTNRRFAEIFSLHEQPARGTSWVQLRRVLSGCRPLSESGTPVVGDLLDSCLRGLEPAAQARQTWGLDDRRMVAVESWPLRREGLVQGRVCTFRDVTEQRDLEHQLRHAQKMESIGRLAGGIAHDFNNILFSIMSISDVLLLDHAGDEELRRDIRQIKQAAERAAGLTRQLLAFSRKQVLTLGVLDLNEVLRGLFKVLPRLIGEDIELSFDLASCPCPVEADRQQLEQILMSLAVNSRDAMPAGGRLVIRTAVVLRGDAPAMHAAGCSPGRYVALTVRDSGHGMSAATAAQIFEPFFTTKEPGKGTGLGLATVYGIVKQHRGDITVRSVEGAGTTFEIQLPWVDAERARAATAASGRSPVVVGRGETVLVVEDDPAVRQVACRILRKHSYRYLCAADGAGAIAIADRPDETIDLLLTDVIMPAMNGPQLYRRLCRLRPDLKVVYMSGYPDETIGQHGVLDQGVRYLQKPFSVNALLRMVRAALDA